MGSPPSPTSHPPHAFEAPSPKISDPPHSQISVDSLMPSSTRLMEEVLISSALPSTLLAGDQSQAPDPRWPSKFRWSSPTSLSVAKSSVVSAASTCATSSPGSLIEDLAISDCQLEKPLGSVVSEPSDLTTKDGSSTPKLVEPVITPAILLPSQTLKQGTEITNPPSVSKDVISSSPPSSASPNLQIEEATVKEKHSLKGAWALPLNIQTITEDGQASADQWPSLLVSNQISRNRKKLGTNSNIVPGSLAQTRVAPTEVRNEDALRFPWAARMDPSTRNLYRAIEPEYLEDGTPKVTIPSHVLRQGVENQKEYVLGQFYRCSPPPGGLIHAVVNKIWGRKCRIFVRNLGDSKYLFHVPDASTRLLILQRGLWHIDDCLMFVAPWTPSTTLALPDISTVPVWLTLKNIPYLCYSIPGISHIASGLGAPMATHKPRLDPTLMGEAKILVEVELSKAFPPRIAVDDKQGCISMVDVEYAWIPTKCGKCGQLGHKVSRCLQQIPIQQGKANEIVTGKVGSEDVLMSDTVVLPLDSSTPAPSSEIQADTNHATISESAPTIEVHVDTAQTTIVEASTTQAAITNVEDIVLASTTQRVTNIDSTVRNVVPSKTQKVESSTLSNDTTTEKVLGDNRFSVLDSAEMEEDTHDAEMEEDTHDSDDESDRLDLMTPFGQRILRERPVKPSTKAKEMEASSKGGGHRGGGRGKRGGRG